jgi:hypothetical protein
VLGDATEFEHGRYLCSIQQLYCQVVIYIGVLKTAADVKKQGGMKIEQPQILRLTTGRIAEEFVIAVIGGVIAGLAFAYQQEKRSHPKQS